VIDSPSAVLVTATETPPALWAGVLTVSDVALALVTLAAVPPNLTVLVEVDVPKPVPPIVT
jgi:hypothetical protein